MPEVIETMKRLYCLWNFKQCARYKVATALSPDQIPDDLYPGDTVRAKIILAQSYSLPD
jgi:hypothetical protein